MELLGIIMTTRPGSPSVSDAFRMDMEVASKVDELLDNTQHDVAEIRDKAKEDVAKQAHKDAVARGVNTHGLTAFDWRDRNQYELAKTIVEQTGRLGVKRASSKFKKNLEGIVRGIDSKKLEGFLGDPTEKDSTAIQLLARTKGYEAWAGKYAAYVGEKQLEARASTGKLTEEDRDALSDPIALAEGAKQKARFAKDGYDSDEQDLADNIQRAVTKLGMGKTKDSYKAAAGARAKEAEKELRAYEKENGKNIYSMVTEAFASMSKTRKGFNEARDTTYGLLQK